MDIKNAVCHFCKGRCRVILHTENGRLIKAEPDESFPVPISTRGCPRLIRGSHEFQYHPDRLSYPLKRAGERGENKWENISWEQAFDEIAERLQGLKDRYGAETLAMTNGTGRNFLFEGNRFMNQFGSPNHCGPGTICWGPVAAVSEAMCGWALRYKSVPKESTESTKLPTKLYLILGSNPAESFGRLFRELQEAKKAGATIIVVDPRPTGTTQLADIWIQLVPGTDAALLMALNHVVIEEGLYDREFVEKWCSGFEEFRQRAAQYTPEKVAEITGVTPDIIIETARICGTVGPAHMVHGMGMEQQQQASEAIHARIALSAITGNIGKQGGETLPGPSGLVPQSEITCDDMLPDAQKKKQIGWENWSLESAIGHDARQSSIREFWGQKCGSYRGAGAAHQPSVFEAMIHHEPYPVKACITIQSNPLLTAANVKRAYKGLKNLDTYVVLDYWMTPSAQLADYVLPIASWMERPFLHDEFGIDCSVWAGEQALPASVPGEYDRKSDWAVLKGVGTRLGQEWPWEDLEQVFDFRLKPWGVTHREFMNQGGYRFPKYVPSHEDLGGFGTRSRLIELCPTVIKELGYDPLPSYYEAFETPEATPELAEEYPFRLITGGRFMPLFHSEFRQINSLRSKHPDPIVQINPDTASDLGIEEGDWVWIETPRGRVRQKCQYVELLAPDVVHVEHGWWFPELPGEEPWLHGMWEANANVLTETAPHSCDKKTGGWPLRQALCRVRKHKEY